MQRRLISISALVIFVMWRTLGASVQERPLLTLHKQMRYLMGTLCEIQVYDPDSQRAEQAIERAFHSVQQADHLLSNYDPDSELSRLNHLADKFPYPPAVELFQFLKQCQQFYRLSFGAFDPTVGPLIRVWKFFTPHPERPTASEIDAARSKVGFDKVELNLEARTVRFARSGMEIDSGGIGKGYAVDRAAGVLREQGITSALVNMGRSTFYAIGKPPDREHWLIGIQDSTNPRRVLAWVELQDNSLSTSDNTEKFVQAGSKRFGHIFDPRTGEPVQGIDEASVVAPTATESDALTKAVFVLSRKQAFQILKGRPGVHALRLEESSAGKPELVSTPWSRAVFKRIKQ